MNRINLFYVALSRGYEDTRWLTFNQIKDAGYTLEKGSKGAKVEYWYPYDKVEKTALTWKKYNMLIKEGVSKERFAIFVKMYTVFNGDNIKGLPEMQEYVNPDVKPGELIEKLSKSMEVPIIHNLRTDHEACYIPSKDEIFLPPVEKFLSTEAYNATALHELGHATGHESRLNRGIVNAFGTEGYAFEELVAEMTSVFMGVHTEIDLMNMDFENHQAYVNSWIEAIDKSPEILSKAIKQAEEATSYMEEKAGLSQELSKSVEKEFESDYMLLGRLASDCEYYLGFGGQDAEHALYYHNEEKHIEEMKKLYDKLPVKPEWLSEEKIKEYEKLLLNKETDILQSFNDRFYKFGVVLTSEFEVRALTHDDGWTTWFDNNGNCMGNTDQLNIWLSDRGNSEYPDYQQFSMPTCEDALEMVESIAKVYGIVIPEAQLGNVIDLEDFGELSFNTVNTGAEFLKEAEESLHAENPVEKLKNLFNDKENEAETERDISPKKARHKAMELEL